MGKKRKQSESSFKTRSFKILIPAILFLGIALRFLTWNNVVVGNLIELKGSDAYYFVRQAENIKSGGIPQFDPMFCYERGLQTDQYNLLYSYIIAFFGQFSSIELVTAFTGPILAGFTIFFIFLTLREIFKNNDLAVISGTAIASLTGIQFIARSYFGFGDRHVLETTFMTMSIWALIKLVNTSSIKWAIVTAFAYILYALSWDGAPVLILLISLSLQISLVIKEPSDKRFWPLLIPFIPLIPLGVFIQSGTLIATGIVSTIGIIYINLLQYKFTNTKRRLIVFTITVSSFLLIACLIYQPLTTLILNTLKSFLLQDAVSSTISEFQPMFNIYKNILDLTSRATIQVIIHGLTVFGLIYMLTKRNFFVFILGSILLISSIAKIRGEYYLLIINAISIGYLALKHKYWGYFGIIIACYFAMLYWGSEVANNKNSSLVFTQNDYNMAEWMRTKLPPNNIPAAGNYINSEKPSYWVLAKWDVGYLYGYLSEKSMVASPNLCNYLFPSYISMSNDEDNTYTTLKDSKVKYILLRYNDFPKYYSETIKTGMTPPEVIGGKIDENVYYLLDQNYFKVLHTKLFNFDGLSYTPISSYYFAGENLTKTDNYLDAFIKSGNGNVYSIDAFKSPIKIDSTQHFKLIHVEGQGEEAVKLFEVID